MKAQKVHKGGHHHNMMRSEKHGTGSGGNHKYEKQAMRTAANKAKHINKAKELKDAAEKLKNAHFGERPISG